jgi:cytoskeletal protein CcmA (bactofilin family)
MSEIAPALERETSGHITAILDRGAKFEGKLSFEGAVQIGGEFREGPRHNASAGLF